MAFFVCQLRTAGGQGLAQKKFTRRASAPHHQSRSVTRSGWSAGMGDPDQDEKSKRVKNLLSLYYANDAAGPAADGGQRKVTAIDSAAFDSEAFVANLV